jgi:hypothetical protein
MDLYARTDDSREKKFQVVSDNGEGAIDAYPR